MSDGGLEWSLVEPQVEMVPVEIHITVEDGEHLPSVSSFTVTRDSVIVLTRPAGATSYGPDFMKLLVDEIARVVGHPSFVAFELIGGELVHASTKSSTLRHILDMAGYRPTPPVNDSDEARALLAAKLRDMADQLTTDADSAAGEVS